MSLLNLFQSKSAAAAAQITAPNAATPTGSAADQTAADAVKSVLAAFSEEAKNDAAKIERIGKKLMDTQHYLLQNAGPREAHSANAKAREDIRGILGELHALHIECKTTGQKLAELSR